MFPVVLLEQVKEWAHVRLTKHADFYEVFFWGRHPDHRPRWFKFARKADAMKTYQQFI